MESEIDTRGLTVAARADASEVANREEREDPQRHTLPRYSIQVLDIDLNE